MRRLYNAICELIEAKADQAREPEPYDSEASSQAELSGAYEPDELHVDQHRLAKAGFTPGSLAEYCGTATPPPVPALPKRKKGWGY